jgi:hypothetical protein
MRLIFQVKKNGLGESRKIRWTDMSWQEEEEGGRVLQLEATTDG